MSSFKPSCASRAFLAKSLRSFLLWVVGGGGFCRSKSGVMRPSQKRVMWLAPLGLVASGAVPAQDQVKTWSFSLSFFPPEGQREQDQGDSLSTLISGTKMSTVENKSGKAGFWHGEFLQVCPVAKMELMKFPPLTSSAVIKCFCAALIKTPLSNSHISK